jgi:hypothetical protein
MFVKKVTEKFEKSNKSSKNQIKVRKLTEKFEKSQKSSKNPRKVRKVKEKFEKSKKSWKTFSNKIVSNMTYPSLACHVRFFHSLRFIKVGKEKNSKNLKLQKIFFQAGKNVQTSF